MLKGYDTVSFMLVIISRYAFIIVIISFLFLGILGGCLLSLPNVINNFSISFIDALFISFSAISGTGISTIPIFKFSSLGKIILIGLMYIGSIGILTIILSIIFYFTIYNISWYGLATEILDIVSINKIASFFKIIFITTFLTQIISVASYLGLSAYLDCQLSFIDSLFLSINIFSNVGFAIQSLVPKIFYTHPCWYLISIFVMLIGGCGFLLLFELQQCLQKKIASESFFLSLTSKIICKVYFVTVFIMWIFYFYFCESEYTLVALVRSLFAAVSLRACGISPYVNLSSSLIFISALYGIFGTAPFGTGGGIKTSLLSIIIKTLHSFFKKENIVTIFHKAISWKLVALAHIFLLYIITISALVSIVIDLHSNHTVDFMLIYTDILGLITGSGALWTPLVSNLATFEKIICILLMIIGKIAGITLTLYISKIHTSSVQYPDAKLIII